MGIVKGIIARLCLSGKKDAMRAWVDEHEREEWVVALRRDNPTGPHFLPLYERIRERFPHFRFVVAGKGVRFENYPVIDCGTEGLLQPPLLALASNDALRACPELVTDPKALEELRAARRSRRRARKPSSEASRSSRRFRALGLRQGLETWPMDLTPPRSKTGTQTDSAG